MNAYIKTTLIAINSLLLRLKNPFLTGSAKGSKLAGVLCDDESTPTDKTLSVYLQY